MSHTRAALILSGVVLAAIEAAADRLTHTQIADAWTQTKLGNHQPLQDIQRAFPFPARTIHEDGPGIILVFAAHGQTCIDFVSHPQESIVSARRC